MNNTVDIGACEYDVSSFHTLYVDSIATGADNGTSWADAYTSLAAAMQQVHSSAVNRILIAKGTYFPESVTGMGVSGVLSNPNLRSFTFMRGELELLGGFPSGGDSIRDWMANPVILSGDTDHNGILDGG